MKSIMRGSSLILLAATLGAAVALPSFAAAQPRRRPPVRVTPRTNTSPSTTPSITDSPDVAAPAVPTTPAPTIAPPTTTTLVADAAPPTSTVHFHAAAFIGYGIGLGDLGASVGGRVGFAFGTRWRFYIGGTASYHAGDKSLTYQTDPATFTRSATTRTSNYAMAGAELGPEFAWNWLRVRAYATAGVLWANNTCSGYLCTPSLEATDRLPFYGIGISPMGVYGRAAFGVDLRLVDVFGDTDTGGTCGTCSRSGFMSFAITGGVALD